MLEESKMDKKTLNRSSQSQSRASAIDCKKNTELTHKPSQRHNKKREVPNNTPKNEPYRKNAPPQKGRGQLDRKPRVREPSNCVVGGTENARLEEPEPEIGSVFVPGSKKQSLNHLLNFVYPTRGGGADRRSNPPPRRYVQKYLPHGYDDDLYLRSYCQFVVKDDADYTVNLQNPDVPVKWEQIEEIIVRSAGRSECPICLGAPVAGRVGRCGHVYCWPCVLHYATAHEKQPPPCPVCATPLQVMVMKPARMLQWNCSGEEVTMRLVRRFRGSSIVEIAPPRGQLVKIAKVSVLPLDKINHAPYSKFFTATKQQVYDIVDRERKEIQNQILAEIDTTEITYLEQALELLKIKEEKINVQYSDTNVVKKVTEDTVPTVYEKQKINKDKIDWFDADTDEGAACIDVNKEQMEVLDVGNNQSNFNLEAAEFKCGDVKDQEELIEHSLPSENEQNVDLSLSDIDKYNQDKYFYFYQADDGQQVYLYKLNVHILIESWGALAAAPSIIRGRVLHRETQPVTEQTRKHIPCTTHLPLHCSFDIVELDLQPPYVTTAALERYSVNLRNRAKYRANQQREERRREHAYRLAMEGPPKPDISSEAIFPPTAPPVSSSPPNLETIPILPSMQISPSTSNSSPPSGLSFAEMASSSGTWRVRKNIAPPTPPPIEDEASAPRTLNLSDAIEAALQAAPASTGQKNKKSKRKYKNVLLFE